MKFVALPQQSYGILQYRRKRFEGWESGVWSLARLAMDEHTSTCDWHGVNVKPTWPLEPLIMNGVVTGWRLAGLIENVDLLHSRLGLGGVSVGEIVQGKGKLMIGKYVTLTPFVPFHPSVLGCLPRRTQVICS